jgi:hydroxymethylpyrimidine pyrophosphatase-like HAD family hydrolase
MSRRYDAVLCDIDGCLGPESGALYDTASIARVAEHNRLAETQRDRPVLTLCSGRPQPFAEALCRLIGNSSLPFIAEMGVWLYDPREHSYLFDPTITPQNLADIADCTRWLRSELVPRGVVIQPGKTATISLWHRDSAFLFAQMTELKRAIAEHGWRLRVTHSVAWVNLELEQVSKASGIRRLIELCDLDPTRLAGIGDTMGDLAIADHVAFFACPDNAQAELKTRAHYVSKHAEIAGVLDILAILQR